MLNLLPDPFEIVVSDPADSARQRLVTITAAGPGVIRVHGLDGPLTLGGAHMVVHALRVAIAHQAVCRDCDHRFDLDSSPYDDLCWQCAERADAEADR